MIGSNGPSKSFVSRWFVFLTRIARTNGSGGLLQRYGPSAASLTCSFERSVTDAVVPDDSGRTREVRYERLGITRRTGMRPRVGKAGCCQPALRDRHERGRGR